MTDNSRPPVSAIATAVKASSPSRETVMGVILGYDDCFVILWDAISQSEVVCHVQGMTHPPDDTLHPSARLWVLEVRSKKFAHPHPDIHLRPLPFQSIIEHWAETYKGGPGNTILYGLDTLHKHLLEGATIEDMICFLEALKKASQELIDDLERAHALSH